MILKEDTTLLNREFEKEVFSVCSSFLHSDLNPVHYANQVLDRLWDGEGYTSGDGTPYHCEIPSRHTYNGVPVTVSV